MTKRGALSIPECSSPSESPDACRDCAPSNMYWTGDACAGKRAFLRAHIIKFSFLFLVLCSFRNREKRRFTLFL